MPCRLRSRRATLRLGQLKLQVGCELSSCTSGWLAPPARAGGRGEPGGGARPAYGPDAGVALLDQLNGLPALSGYHLLPSVRGDLLDRLGWRDEAKAEFAEQRR
jgi:hypothetical protein